MNFIQKFIGKYTVVLCDCEHRNSATNHVFLTKRACATSSNDAHGLKKYYS